jgi:hypothetical protein
MKHSFLTISAYKLKVSKMCGSSSLVRIQTEAVALK